MTIKVKENLRRLTALMLCAVIVISFSITSYANDSDSEQMSDANITENNDKVSVVLPTDAVGIFDFILDPQELINKTNASPYDGKIFEEGATLFFKRSEDDALVDYSSTSDAVTIINKGNASIDIDITASITVFGKDGLAMTDDSEFTDDKRPSLYLALTDEETKVPIMGEDEEAASLSITIPPKSEDEEGTNEYSFRLTGAANKEGDWTGMNDLSFEVAVTWAVVAEREENVAENEEMPFMEEQEQVISMDSGEEIVRKIVPVASDSNANRIKE